MKNFKPVLISFAAMILVSLASCNTTPPILDSTQISSGTVVETKAGQKIYIRHFGLLGPQFHQIDAWLYYEIIDIILAYGGDPTKENIDEVYDHMPH
jgi:hypothetical protein